MWSLVAAWLLTVSAAEVGQIAEPPAAVDWQYARTSYIRNAKQMSSGYVAWAQTADGRGAAFRCDKGILYAFVALQPVDLYAELTRLGATRKQRTVTVEIDGHAPREEEWVSIHGGSFMMPRRISTTRWLFRGARNGTRVSISGSNRDPVVAEIPADDGGILDRFEALCELHARFDAD